MLGWFHIGNKYETKHINRFKKKNLSKEFDEIEYIVLIFKKRLINQEQRETYLKTKTKDNIILNS